MSKNSQTQTSSVDPGTAAYIEQYRQRAASLQPYQTGLGGIQAYMNPYQDSAIAGMRGEFGYQRSLANNSAADMATRAGAFGGGREAILRAQMMGDVNRNEASTVSGMLDTGYQNAVQNMYQDRMNAANVGFGNLNAMTPGFTPTSQTQTMTQKNSIWPQLLGIAGTVGGALAGGPQGAAVGGSLGSTMGGASSGGGMPGTGMNTGGSGGGFGGGGGGMSWGIPQQPYYGAGHDPWAWAQGGYR